MAVGLRSRDANEQIKIAISIPILVVSILADGHLLINDFPPRSSVPRTLQHQHRLKLNENIGKSFTISSSLLEETNIMIMLQILT